MLLTFDILHRFKEVEWGMRNEGSGEVAKREKERQEKEGGRAWGRKSMRGRGRGKEGERKARRDGMGERRVCMMGRGETEG